MARASRTHGPFAVAMADVDRFKAINDTYGHQAGDAVLREASRRLRGAMRTYDSLGRYGGDEFLAVVPGCDPAAAARFAESFRARIDRKAVETPEGLIPVTLSLGVVALENLRDVVPGPVDKAPPVRGLDIPAGAPCGGREDAAVEGAVQVQHWRRDRRTASGGRTACRQAGRWSGRTTGDTQASRCAQPAVCAWRCW